MGGCYASRASWELLLLQDTCSNCHNMFTMNAHDLQRGMTWYVSPVALHIVCHMCVTHVTPVSHLGDFDASSCVQCGIKVLADLGKGHLDIVHAGRVSSLCHLILICVLTIHDLSVLSVCHPVCHPVCSVKSRSWRTWAKVISTFYMLTHVPCVSSMTNLLVICVSPCVQREIKILADLGDGHLNIVHADEVLLTKTHVGLVMEYVSGGWCLAVALGHVLRSACAAICSKSTFCAC
jgi:hypothetical protein